MASEKQLFVVQFKIQVFVIKFFNISEDLISKLSQTYVTA
jgi:hypothetical protein